MIIKRQAFSRSYPYPVIIVNDDTTGYIAGYTLRILILMPVDSKIITVIFIKSVISGKPQIAFFILIDSENGTMRQPFFQTDMCETHTVYFTGKPHTGKQYSA